MMRYFSLAILFLASAFLANASWKTSEIFHSSGGVTVNYGLFIDPTSKIRHVVLHAGKGDQVYYKRVGPDGNILDEQKFSGPHMNYADEGKLVGSDDGKKLFLVMSGYTTEARKTRDLWYKESVDGGRTWTETVRIPHENDDLSREGTALLVIPKTGRLYIFYSASKEVGKTGVTYIRMVSKLIGGSTFTPETEIYNKDPKQWVRYGITAEYTMNGGKPIIHVVWVGSTGKLTRNGWVHYLRSESFGVSWTYKLVSDNTLVSDQGRLESAAAHKLTNTFAVLYNEHTEKHLWHLITFQNHGAKIDSMIITEATQVPPHYQMHIAGMGLCGTKEKPVLYTLIDNDNDPPKFQVMDLNSMELRTLDHPFIEEQANVYGISFACSTTGKKTSVAAVTYTALNTSAGKLMIDNNVYDEANQRHN